VFLALVTCEKILNGFNRRTMECFVSNNAQGPQGESWPTTSGYPQGTEWNIVGMSNWCSVARHAGALSFISNLSSVFSALVFIGTVEQNTLVYSRGPQRTRKDRFKGMLYRWHVRSGQKRGSGIGNTKKGKGTKIMAIADASGLPVSLWVGAANTHEVKLVEKSIDAKHIKTRPQILIGDQAYDSDPLDKALKKRKIKLVAPHKRNRKRKPTQDGRTLRRYTKRWKVERLFAWLQNYRRCATRYDYHVENFLGFVQLACIVILVKVILR